MIMGHSTWNDDFYRDRAAERKRTGTTVFTHHKAISEGKAKREVHASMNPKGITRESRDSEAHPRSVPVIVGLDVTGSMHNTPKTMQGALPKLMEVVKESGTAHPQILFAAIGDAVSDRAPCQIGQFESGIEMEDDLGRIFMEGSGGGTYEESYELLMYFAARHTVTDAFEKRGEKGWLFMIGDEHCYPTVGRDRVKRLFGDTLQADIPTEEIVKEVRERFNVFFFIPRDTAHGRDPALKRYWEKLIGVENVGELTDPSDLCNAIARVVARKDRTKPIPVSTSANVRL
jgi:hypothetical protein